MPNLKGKQSKSDVNKSLRSRVEFLDRASQYLHAHANLDEKQDVQVNGPDSAKPQLESDSKSTKLQMRGSGRSLGAGRYFAAQMRATSRKSQVRIAQDMKRSTCKRCDARLDTTNDYTEVLENPSRNGRKPWTAVRVITCNACGTPKRFPVGATRQMRKSERLKQQKKAVEHASGPSGVT